MQLDAQRIADKEARESALAEIAYSDYLNLGPNRTLSALLAFYKRVALEDGPDRAPSRNRAKLTEWRKKYRWDERARQEDEAEVQSARRDLTRVRRQAIEDLADLHPLAIEVYRTLLTSPSVEAKEKRMAADSVLNRIGVTEKPARDNASAEAIISPPAHDASDAELEQWLSIKPN